MKCYFCNNEATGRAWETREVPSTVEGEQHFENCP